MRQILSFTCIPTLSRHLYSVPKYKYLSCFQKDDDNKIINLIVKQDEKTFFDITNNYKLFCLHTGTHLRNTFITSNFILEGRYKNNYIHISENTYFDTFDQDDTILLKYELRLKLNNQTSNILRLEYLNSNVNFTDDLWYIIPENYYKIIKDIDETIQNNKKMAYVDKQMILPIA